MEGNVLLDQSSTASTPMEPDPDRITFYNQLGLRRNIREYFDEAYGNTDFIHIIREKNTANDSILANDYNLPYVGKIYDH